jgi:hypothetical protein
MESLFCESKHGLILSNSAKNDSTGLRFTPNQHKVLTHAWKVLVCVKQKTSVMLLLVWIFHRQVLLDESGEGTAMDKRTFCK